MEQWLQFLQERWVVIVLALFAITVLVKVVKTVIKWVLIAAIMIGVVYYGINYTDSIREVGSQVMDVAKEQVFQTMTREAANARYTMEPDGSFTIQSDNLTVKGKAGSDEVEITFMGQSFTLTINEVIQAYIDGAKANKGA